MEHYNTAVEIYLYIIFTSEVWIRGLLWSRVHPENITRPRYSAAPGDRTQHRPLDASSRSAVETSDEDLGNELRVDDKVVSADLQPEKENYWKGVCVGLGGFWVGGDAVRVVEWVEGAALILRLPSFLFSSFHSKIIFCSKSTCWHTVHPLFYTESLTDCFYQTSMV